MDMPDVGEKIGPLPVWAWALLGGGLILIAAKIGHSGGGGTVVTSLGGGTPIVNGVDPQQAASDREKAVADAITKQQGADQTILDQVKSQMQATIDSITQQGQQALADLRAQDAQALAASQAADNANLASQRTGFLAQIAALKDQIAAAIKAGQDAVTATHNQDLATQDKIVSGLQATIDSLRAQLSQAQQGGGSGGGTAPPASNPNPFNFQAPTTAAGWAAQAASLFGVVFQWSQSRLEAGSIVPQGWTLPVAYNGVHDLVRISTGGGTENAAARVSRWVADAMSTNPGGDPTAAARVAITRLGADALDSAGVGNISQDEAGQILWSYGFDFGPVWQDIVALRRQRGTI